MSSEAIFRQWVLLWALLCGVVGVFRLAVNFDRESLAWRLEAIFTLLSFALAALLLEVISHTSL